MNVEHSSIFADILQLLTFLKVFSANYGHRAIDDVVENRSPKKNDCFVKIYLIECLFLVIYFLMEMYLMNFTYDTELK